jgi:hypothetical protein
MRLERDFESRPVGRRLGVNSWSIDHIEWLERNCWITELQFLLIVFIETRGFIPSSTLHAHRTSKSPIRPRLIHAQPERLESHAPRMTSNLCR